MDNNRELLTLLMKELQEKVNSKNLSKLNREVIKDIHFMKETNSKVVVVYYPRNNDENATEFFPNFWELRSHFNIKYKLCLDQISPNLKYFNNKKSSKNESDYEIVQEVQEKLSELFRKLFTTLLIQNKRNIDANTFIREYLSMHKSDILNISTDDVIFTLNRVYEGLKYNEQEMLDLQFQYLKKILLSMMRKNK